MDAPTHPSAPELKPELPLLPAVLLGPAAFLWLWVLPIGVLLLLNLQAFWLIEGNLSESQRSDAILVGAGNFIDLLTGLALFFVARHHRETGSTGSEPQPWWGVPAILVQIGYLWWTVAWTDRILPASVTTWIYPSERHLFNQFAFAMLPLFLGILRLAGARLPRNFGKSLAINLGVAIAGPILLYFFSLAIWGFGGFGKMRVIAFATVVVVLGVLMFVGLVRALMLGLRGIQRWGQGGERVAILVFAVLLPLAGLGLNRTIPFPVDFQAWEIYALVVANAGILLLASFQHARWPRLSFYLCCATFPFSLYFFIVFLPYTPLSILAVIAMGAGFLVLTPTFLFILHLHALRRSRRHLAADENQWRVRLTGTLCFLLLPAFFTGRGLADKAALNAALDYVYSPAITAEKLIYPSSLTNLRRALHNHRSYKNGIYYPLLSDYYSWLVFDNLVLPDDKLDRLESTFFGAAGSRLNTDPLRQGINFWGNERSVRDRMRMPRANPMPRTVAVSQLELQTAPAPEKNAVTTFILTLQNTGSAPAEFVQKLPLPSGMLVNGFRLHINGQPVPGRIFEKKTALWVYAMIRDSERRDPGLLYYTTPDELELRVLPVAANATTTVEIDFLLPHAIALENLSVATRDPTAALAQIGRALQPQMTGDRGELVVAGLSPGEFPVVAREPYLHLIVDRSLENAYAGDLSPVIATLRKKFPNARQARVTLAHYDVIDLVADLTPLDELAKKITATNWELLPASGGLALDLCVAHALRQHRDRDLDHASPAGPLPSTPIFVILSQNASIRSLELGLAKTWTDLVPGLRICELGANGTFQTHLSEANSVPLLRMGNSVRPLATRQPLRFPETAHDTDLAYWSPQNSRWQPVSHVTLQTDPTPWSRAEALQSQQQDHDRTPGAYPVDQKALVAASRESGILLSSTSYIVVENAAQWRMLELSERQKLDQNAALSFRETPAPSALWLGSGLVLWFGFRQLRRRGKNFRAMAPCHSEAIGI